MAIIVAINTLLYREWIDVNEDALIVSKGD